MTDQPQPNPGIMDIAPYVPGKAAPKDTGDTFKLSANESPLGASPKALAALKTLGSQLADYPDGGSTELRLALADKHGLEAARIIIGAGSDELLHLIAQTYLGRGDEAVISEFGFLVYPIVTRGAGAKPVVAQDKDYVVDVDAMLDAVSPRTRVVFLANPNNPTGTYLSAPQVRRLHVGLPKNVLLVIDSAYAEYVDAPDYSACAELAREFDNVVMVRTFSKIGLAALRIGWLYGPDRIVDALNRLRGPFNVNRAAQLAGVAAVGDDAFTTQLAAHNAKWRAWLTAELHSNQIRVVPSQGNFILALFPQNGSLTAQSANQALLEAGVVVREMGGYGLPHALRISIGTEKAMRKVADILKGMRSDD